MSQNTTNAIAERIGGPERAPAELLDVQAVATMCNCSVRHVYRLSDGGRMPRPLKLGSLVRWRRLDVMDWIADGCQAVRAAKGGAR